MNIPYEMQEATEKMLEERSVLKIRNCVSSICERYNNESGQGRVLVKNEEEAVSYAVSRMPGTFGAVKSALTAFREVCDFEPRSLADIGSGTGAAVWAAASEYEFERITCFERESSMIEIGRFMLSYGNDAMQKASWLQRDITAAENDGEGQISADLVTASYIMNELRPAEREGFLNALWNISDKAIVIIEPGTKEGYKNILLARESFLKKGAFIVAPCTHSEKCPLAADDWCHFTCRMQRSKIQKFVKGGDAPYEDEKFSYLAVIKDSASTLPGGARIIRHPMTNKGYVGLKTCSAKGIEEKRITAKDKAAYKAAKKAEWGDLIPKTT